MCRQLLLGDVKGVKTAAGEDRRNKGKMLKFAHSSQVMTRVKCSRKEKVCNNFLHSYFSVWIKDLKLKVESLPAKLTKGSRSKHLPKTLYLAQMCPYCLLLWSFSPHSGFPVKRNSARKIFTCSLKKLQMHSKNKCFSKVEIVLNCKRPLQDNKGIWAEMKMHINVLRAKPK